MNNFTRFLSNDLNVSDNLIGCVEGNYEALTGLAATIAETHEAELREIVVSGDPALVDQLVPIVIKHPDFERFLENTGASDPEFIVFLGGLVVGIGIGILIGYVIWG